MANFENAFKNGKIKPKIGVLLIGSERFKGQGKGTPGGAYEERLTKRADKIAAGLSSFADIVYNGPVFTRDALHDAMLNFTANEVDGVFTLYLSWGEDSQLIRFIRDMPEMPVLFACLTMDKIPFASDYNNLNPEDATEANTYRGLVGSLQISGSIARYNRPMMETFVGTLDEIVEKSRLFFTAAAVRAKLKNFAIANLERPHDYMWSTYVHAGSLFQKVGPELKFLSLAAVQAEADTIPDEEVEATVKILADKYEVAPDVPQDLFNASVRASMAMDRYATKNGCSIVVMHDLDPATFRILGLRPGFLPVPNGNGVVAVPEGDVGGTVAVSVMKMISGKVVDMIEPGYIDKNAEVFQIGHGGPNDYTDPEGAVKIVRDGRFINSPWRYPGAPFTWYRLPAGVKTLLHISETDGHFKCACTLVEVLPADHHFYGGFSHGMARTLTGKAQDVFGKLIAFGVTQHYAMAPGDYRAEIREFAKIMGFEFLEV